MAKVISAKGLFGQVNEKTGILISGKISESLLGNGYTLSHREVGTVYVLETGPNKGMWVAVSKVGSIYVKAYCPPYKAPSKRPTYHDHM